MLYANFTPTPMDHHLHLEDRDDWIVAPCTQNRDSGALDRSNFRVQERILEDLGIETETHRFGHWGPGWYEILLVEPGGADAVDEIAQGLADYPVLDDEDFSEEEHKETEESWESWGYREISQEVADHLADLMGEECDDLDDHADLRGVLGKLEDAVWSASESYVTCEGPTFEIDIPALLRALPDLTLPHDTVEETRLYRIAMDQTPSMYDE